MNVEMSCVRATERKEVLGIVESRIRGQPDSAGKQPDWGLPSSYDTLLASDKKRRVAVSPLRDGWIALVESKEVLDFSLLQNISSVLKTDVVAIQVSDIVGACGYALCNEGTLREKYFSELDEEPLATARTFLQQKGIPFDVLTFREAIQLRGEGWTIV